MGILAAPALVSLMDWQDKLTVDNQNAAFLAHELAEIPGVVIDPLTVETNILRFEFDPKTKRRLKTDYK